jgi:hypothetical protein
LPEAQRRLAEFGPNHVEEVGRESLLLRFAREFTHFFAIILWVGAALAFLAEYFDPGQGMARLGVAIVGVILLNGVFSFWQEYKAERAVDALRQLLPQQVTAFRRGEIVELLASDLVPGDIVLLEEGDFVPADCRVIEAFGLRVNIATITGESLPKARNADSYPEMSPLLAKNIVLAGTTVVSGQARAVVYATGMRTEFGKIAHLTQTVGAVTSPLQREIARLSRIVAVLPDWSGARPAVLGKPAVHDRHHRRQRAGGPAADGDAVAGDGDAAHGEAQCAGAAPASGGGARLDHGDPVRQDRHADAEPHVGATSVAGWRIRHARRYRGAAALGGGSPRALHERRALPQPERDGESRQPRLAG